MKIKVDLSKDYVDRFEVLKLDVKVEEMLEKLFRKLVIDAEMAAEKRKMEKELTELQRKKLAEANF